MGRLSSACRGGGRATLVREGAYWRITFARQGQSVTMDSLSGNQFDSFVAGNVAESIATFLEQ